MIRQKITVVIPTHSRPAQLRKVLEAAVSQKVEDFTVDVVVVENGTREADSISADFGVRYMHLTEANASLARNAGAAGADIVAFLDDDAIPAHGWLQALVAPLVAAVADATVGSVSLVLGGDASDATRENFVETARVMNPAKPFLIGMNMAVKGEAFAEVGGFNPQLGPGALGGHEDVLFGLQMAALGKKLAYVSEAHVEHHVPADRLSPEALLSRTIRAAKSDGWVTYHWLQFTPTLLRLRIVRSRITILTAKRTRDADRERAAIYRYWRERQIQIEKAKGRSRWALP